MLAEKLLKPPSTVTNYIEDVFSTYLYTGASGAQSINNGIDLSTKGGLLWLKDRTTAGTYNYLADSARGPSKTLSSNTTDAQSNYPNYITSFNTDGFTIGAGQDNVGDKYASWTFRKQPKFFDVVTYTGTGSAQNVAHSLGSVPACIIVKRTDTTADWSVYHVSTGNGYATALNSNLRPVGPIAGFWNSTTPTSTEFTVGNHSTTNASGGTYVAYILASNAGGFGLTGTDNVITCSSFTTDGSGNATVTLGYEPQWVLIRNITRNTVDWHIDDNMRGMPTSGQSRDLKPNLSDAETGNPLPNPTATGFTVTGVADFGGADTYIYIAIRRGPMKVPTDATKVYTANPYTGTDTDGRLITSGFPVDSAIIDPRNGYSTPGGPNWFSRLTGNGYFLKTASIVPQQNGSSNSNGIMGQDGITVSRNGTNVWSNVGSNTYVPWFLRRAPKFYDEICYTGTGLQGTTFNHNLGVAPELWIIKSRDNFYDWYVGSTQMTSSEYLRLNVYDPKSTSTIIWNNTYPSSTVITFSYASGTNASGATYVGHLFASCPGVSKVGKYTGTGTLTTIDCGFSSGARFVLIKRLDYSSDWFVWDTARGMVAGTDPSLSLNTTAAESNANSVYTIASGFQLLASPAADVNTSGGTYLYLAIA